MSDELEIKGKVEVITDKAIKIEKEWYSTTYAKGDTVVKGDEVVLTYKKNKAFKNVSNIKKVVKVEAPKVEVQKEEVANFVCEDCGKELKDGKYTKCFTCNKKSPAKTTSFSDDRTAQIVKGNSLNAAGAAVAGNFPGAQPADIAEAMIIIARRGLEYLQE